MINDRYIIRNVLTLLMSFVAILSFAMLTSCSNDEVEPTPVPDLKPMSFGGDIAAATENTTRAAGDEGLENYAKSFVVYGYKNFSDNTQQTVFPGYRVSWSENSAYTTTTNTCDWEYEGLTDITGEEQSVKYWDTSANEYRIFGVTSENTVTDGKITLNLNATTAEDIAKAPYFSGLWYSNSVKDCVDQPITLEFLKPFCMVRIMFVGEDGLQYTQTANLVNQVFKPISDDDKMIQKANFNLTYNLAYGSSKDFTYTVDNINATLEKISEPYEEESNCFAETLKKWYTLIPPASQGAYKMSATVIGTDKEVTVPAELMQWKPNYSYTYIFKITSSGDLNLLNVTEVAIRNWLNGRDTNHPVYNW